MRNKITALVIACALGGATTAVAAVQDFESFSEFDVITGVDLGGFSITAGGDGISVLNAGNFFGTGNFIQTDPFDNSNPYRADFSVSGVSSVSVDVGDNNQDPDDLFLRAYDAFDTLLSSFAISITSSFVGFETLTVTGTDIAYVVFGGAGQGGRNNVYADNFSYQTVSPIPLPAALPLLATAFGGLGFLARRRRRKS
jgi:hypothetical protein